MGLAAIILTRDEARHVAACVDSLRWADDIVVFDSYSRDDTVTLARQAGAQVIQHPFQDFASQRNAALEMVRADWVFFVDADERATAQLAAEVRQVIAGPEVGWWVPRDNYIFGRLTRSAGWYPDYQMRLLRRSHARYDPAQVVHEVVVLDGPAGTLQSALIHYNYENLAQFIRKQRLYATYDARILAERGESPKVHYLITLPLHHFWYRFITLRGYRDGAHGLLLSLLMAGYQAEVQRRLWATKH